MPLSTNLTPQEIAQIEDTLRKRSTSIQTALTDAIKKAMPVGMQAFGASVDIGRAILDEGLRQAKVYEEEIVDVYGDITTQSETYGKSAAKLVHERVLDLREDFLQMEAGGVKLMNVYENVSDAANDAASIIGALPGATYQFTDDLQKQNLSVIQLLKKAAGLSETQTAAIMKIAKSRGEDSKQMLADIGTFSKTLADKFGLDAKNVARSVADMTANTSTFGKVSVEAATAAAIKFEAMGVSFEEVADSIGGTFGNFSSAADAAAKLSQVFGVNIDAMQMMVDVNSGPEGMTRALDNMRESLIGAGVDASELSAPLRRLIKDMTGVRDDATIESLFDPDRIGIESDEIIAAAAKAAEAQKDPLESIKYLDKDIAKVRRSLAEMGELTSKQVLMKFGKEAVETAKDFSDLNSAISTTIDSFNQMTTSIPTIKQGFDTGFKTAQVGAQIGIAGAEAADQVIKNSALQSNGTRIEESNTPDYGVQQKAESGVYFNKSHQDITGVTPSTSAIQYADVRTRIAQTKDLSLEAAAEGQKQGGVTPEKAAELAESLTLLQTAIETLGVDVGAVMNVIGAGNPAAIQAQPATPGAAPVNMINAVLQPVPANASPAQATPAPSTPAQPASSSTTTVAPVSPVVVPPTVPAALAAAAAAAPAAAAATPAAASTTSSTASSAAAIRTAGTTTPEKIGNGTAVATSSTPTHINLTVTLDAGTVATALARYTNIAAT